MKRFSFIGAYLIAFLVVCVVTILTCSCKGENKILPFADGGKSTADSVLFAQYISHAIDPEFSSHTEIYQFRKCKAENARTDSIFMSIDDETIMNVASVLFKKSASIKRRDIVAEYTKNKNIYAALPRKIEISDGNNSGTEDRRETTVGIPAETTLSVDLKDTIIGGNKYRIETKLVKYNE